MDKHWIKVISRWLATVLFLLIAMTSRRVAITNAAPVPDTGSPSFVVAEHHFDVHCTSPFTSLALISWRTSSEANVTGYKVHRTLLDDPEENRWVNRYAIAALGSETEYHVIDSQAVPGRTYRYRVYGFEESGRLSLATPVMLAEGMQPSCFYLPLIFTTGSIPTD